MKRLAFIFIFFSCLTNCKSQDDKSLNFYGSLESSLQLLRDDSSLNFSKPDKDFRSNNYLKLNLNYASFTAGLQYEAYLPEPLFGFDPELDDHGLTTYFLQYDYKDLQFTAGYFYEQFGSGLILRAWEDRQLGINNSIRGGRFKWHGNWIDFTTLYGVQRNRFVVSDGVLAGADAMISLDDIFNLEDIQLDIGMSYVSRKESIEAEVPDVTGAYSGRFSLSSGQFSTTFEYNYKEPDILVYNGTITNNAKLFSGTAALVDFNYVKKGFGMNLSLRRLENFSFYSERLAEGNQYNQLLVNYVPALTKQHDYLLNNIYVYSSQNRLIFQTFAMQAGEIGYQGNIFYSIPEKSFFGGYYGTYLDFNFSRWAGLKADFDLSNNNYSSGFIGFGDTYFQEFSLDIKKKWSEKWNANYALSSLEIDKGVVDGSPLGFKQIEAYVFVADHSYEIKDGKSVRLELQHLWTAQDRGNWAASLLEYQFNYNLGVYATDSWNYGGEDQIHYYNFGSTYTKGSANISLNYGRQRGGLICVGGVCRYVPENTGFSVNLSYAF